MKNFNLLSILIVISSYGYSQSTTIEYLDINNVRAGILSQGDMFHDPITLASSYEFPKGTGKHSNFALGLWVTGMDTNNSVLHVSAQTYRQKGSDYWTGPLDENNAYTISAVTSNNWDKIWKVNLSTIDSFKALTTHTLSNTPLSILTWPAKGNLYANGKNGFQIQVSRDMAPFVDVNNDSIYNALDGDYPKIKGEQMLWWVFNDVKPHTESGGAMSKLEIHASAYAYNSLPAIQNVTFYDFSIHYFDTIPLHNCRISIFDDVDLGYGFDDYVGCDSIRKLAIGYNGDSTDIVYGSQLTQTGLLILKKPLISSPTGSFMTYDNTFTSFGNPTTAEHYYLLARSKWHDSTQLTNACNGYSAGTAINYAFYDDPSIIGGVSERACNHQPNDRRFILSTGDLTMLPNNTYEIQIAVLNTPLGSSNLTFTAIRDLADSVFLYSSGCSNISTPDAVFYYTPSSSNMTMYPNPILDNFTIQSDSFIKEGKVEIVNSLGQIIYVHTLQNSIQIDTHSWSKGIYYVKVYADGELIKRTLVK
ncbi:MAG: T9SS type A sorting domain-containing protein [Chitinophagaceae bacterium]